MGHREEKWIVSGSAFPDDTFEIPVEAFQDGKKAFHNGAGYYDNPYEPHIRYKSTSAVYWRNGYLIGNYEKYLRHMEPKDWPLGNPLPFLFWDGKKWTQNLSQVRIFTSGNKAAGCGRARYEEAKRRGAPLIGNVWIINMTNILQSFPLPLER